MKQPNIKCTRVCKEYGRGPYQLANHWNIAKGHIEKLQSIINRLYLDECVLPYDVKRAIEDELGNARVGIHNLGQELTTIEGYEYDFRTVEEVRDWENPEKSIYANRTKKYKIEDIEA